MLRGYLFITQSSASQRRLFNTTFTSNFKRSFSSQQAPNVVPDKSESDSAPENAEIVIDEYEHAKYSWADSFRVSHTKDVRTVHEGAFMDISKTDLQKYFPEGLAGDAGKY